MAGSKRREPLEEIALTETGFFRERDKKPVVILGGHPDLVISSLDTSDEAACKMLKAAKNSIRNLDFQANGYIIHSIRRHYSLTDPQNKKFTEFMELIYTAVKYKLDFCTKV